MDSGIRHMQRTCARVGEEADALLSGGLFLAKITRPIYNVIFEVTRLVPAACRCQNPLQIIARSGM